MASSSRSNDRSSWSHDAAVAAEYDLAIAGAGPAGSVLALLCARAGLRVLLAERSRFDRPRVGETAPPEIKALLTRLGLAHALEGRVCREAPGLVSIWGSSEPLERTYISSPYGGALHIDRMAFDSALAHEAHLAGADLRVATAIRFEPSQQGGFDVVTGAGRRTRAPLAVLAGGRSSGSSGLPYVRAHLDDHAAVFASFPAPSLGQDQRTMIEAVPGGWFYLAQLASGCIAVVLVTRATSVPAGKSERLLWWLAMFAKTTIVRLALNGFPLPCDVSVCDARASFAVTPAGADWCAIGDARLAPDPLAGLGMLWAIEDAMVVAEAIAKRRERDLASIIVERTHRDIAEFLSVRDQVYADERRFPTDPYWTSRVCGAVSKKVGALAAMSSIHVG